MADASSKSSSVIKSGGDAMSIVKSGGEVTEGIVRMISGPDLVQTSIANLNNAAAFSMGASACAQAVETLADTHIKLTDGRDQLRAQTEHIRVRTEEVLINTAPALTGVFAGDLDHEVVSVRERSIGLLRGKVFQGDEYEICKEKGARRYVLLVAILDNHDTVTRLKNIYLPPSLVVPDHVSLQTKVFSTGRGQAIFDEVEETMQGKLERLVRSDDTYNIYFLLGSGVHLARDAVSRLTMTHLGPITSAAGEFYGDCIRGANGMPRHFLPVGLQLHIQLGKTSQLVPILNILSMSKPDGKAFLAQRFHDVLFYGTEADIKKAHGWAAFFKRHQGEPKRKGLKTLGLVVGVPVAAALYFVTVPAAVAWYTIDKGVHWAKDATYLYYHHGAYNPSEGGREVLQKAFGWKVAVQKT